MVGDQSKPRKEKDVLSQQTVGAARLTPGSRGAAYASALRTIGVLVAEALEAGEYRLTDDVWRRHYQGACLAFRDRWPGIERTGRLVIAPALDEAILEEAVTSDLHSYVVVGGSLSDDADLGAARARRLERAAELGEHYWSVYVLEGAIQVAIGVPPSPCRLICDILNAQMGQPFVQRRVCACCSALNPYHQHDCVRCGEPLIVAPRPTDK